ncbi:hypothetical protein KFK14_17725 [Sphingobium phenoxybenzoativorans]|uniref:Uncharacterized protein n=1 Tax=Sphingobium phenoxybenzoativorans TaxID=1592790 RepID=A0A975K4W0_9SPHN|nr:hypothetical protein [Sphingobium phenoxybenzoativorans]QUT04851.1 hypothetical protein KFK14_17725 [Sphingobium phenoxybenzoativorans]
MMKRDFSSAINDLRNSGIRVGVTVEAVLTALNEIADDIGETAGALIQTKMDETFGKTLTFGAACADALIAPQNGEEKQSIGERSKRLALAMKIVDGGEIEISPDDRDLIKTAVNAHFRGALVPGRIDRFLEAE